MLIILTGEKGAGKSTLLADLAHAVKKPYGVVCLRPSKGVLEANLLPSFKKVILADESGDGGEESVKFCSYFFRTSALAQANEAIANGGAGGTLLVDEIGFWEAEGGGYSPNSEMIAARTLPTVLSIRKDAVGEICRKWELKPALTADIGLLGRDKTYALLHMALQI
jgi:nucleoside-triphosphatase THEP1